MVLTAMFVCLCAMPVWATEAEVSGVLAHPGLSICLADSKDRDILLVDMNLTPEELQVIADLVVSESAECAVWLSACRAVVSDASTNHQQKLDAIRALPIDDKSQAFLEKTNAKLNQTLAEGQRELLKIWLEEEWRMITSAPFEPKAGADQLVAYLKTRMTVSDNSARRIRQAWSYYKTIELTHRQKLKKFPHLDPANDISYLRMMRLTADDSSIKALDESDQAAYRKLMRSQK